MTDSSSFFNYPTLAGQPAAIPVSAPGFLADCTEDEWGLVLAEMETRRFAPGDRVLVAGEVDRAFYLLTDGRLQTPSLDGRSAPPIRSPALIGAAAFVDGLGRGVTVEALDHGEMLRMGFEAWESLAAREPRLGRVVLLDIARSVAQRARAAAGTDPGWTG